MRKISIGELRLLTDAYGEAAVLAHHDIPTLLRSIYDFLDPWELSLIRDLYIEGSSVKAVAAKENVTNEIINGRKRVIFQNLRKAFTTKEGLK